MKLLYAKDFGKDLEAISHNPRVKKRLLQIIEKLKATDSLYQIHGVKKIEG